MIPHNTHAYTAGTTRDPGSERGGGDSQILDYAAASLVVGATIA